jgi:hypothetical protein
VNTDQQVAFVLSPASLDHLANAVASHVAARLNERRETTTDGWMDSADAARYIGRSISSLHKLTAARRIPFSQDGPGAKCFFRRSDLDDWMASR